MSRSPKDEKRKGRYLILLVQPWEKKTEWEKGEHDDYTYIKLPFKSGERRSEQKKSSLPAAAQDDRKKKKRNVLTY